MRALIDRLERGEALEDAHLAELLDALTDEDQDYLFERARAVRDAVYGRAVFIRGLIEYTNYCKNDCFYCGIRHSNDCAQRYRLSAEQIMDCCRQGYRLGFRTFVLQGGEDPYFTDERLVALISGIKAQYPDCAVTLSLGERSDESYRRLYEAGADRYLLRHETADAQHYARLHPPQLSLDNRMRCLRTLKQIGFQTGAGFMVGSPGQTTACIIKDLRFLRELAPQMVGIGPFIPHHDTPFVHCAAGSVERTLRCLALVRLMLPRVLLPATTALGTLDESGRVKGMNAGCNVVMPNLSPGDARGKYLLYDNKIATGDEAAESLESLRRHMAAAGYTIVSARGDYKGGKNA